jgi:protoporphyrinogen/coproporphyrinogen III oxidase
MPEQDEGRDVTRFTVMMGGHMFKDKFGDPNTVDQSLLKRVAADSVHKYLGIPSSLLEDAHVSVHQKCIPQYNVGHQHRLKEIGKLTDELGFLTLVGASYKGVAINDIVANSRLAAIEIASKLSNK